MKKTVVVTSGGFDPIHQGHIEYLELASKLGDIHICIMNSDDFLIKKKGYCLLNEKNRLSVLSGLSCIDTVVRSVDTDNTVNETLSVLRKLYPEYLYNMIFAKGGDRNSKEIPEASICKELGIDIVDELGAKIESSSKLVRDVNIQFW